MSEKSAIPESNPAAAPSVQQAANDLREAAGEKARKITRSAEERAQQLKESATQKAQQFRDFAKDKASHLTEAAEETAQHLKDATEGQWDETRVKAREVHADVEEFIRQHPTKSILVAAAAGFLLGLLVRR